MKILTNKAYNQLLDKIAKLEFNIISLEFDNAALKERKYDFKSKYEFLKDLYDSLNQIHSKTLIELDVVNLEYKVLIDKFVDLQQDNLELQLENDELKNK